MAVQVITKKRIVKHDTNSPNFKPPEPKVVEEEVNGNLKENFEDDIYGETKHTYQPDNGNLQMSEFMTGVMNKLDGLTVNPDIVKKNRAIEVDIKREIAISKADINGVTSEEIKGKVMNKKDKLKALRRRRNK